MTIYDDSIKLTLGDQGVTIRLGDDRSRRFSWLWLRDHSTDAGSVDPTTRQRQVDTFSLPDSLRAVSAQVNARDRCVDLVWSDGVSTSVQVELLATMMNAHPPSHQTISSSTRRLWDCERPLKTLPSVTFNAVMGSAEGVLSLLDNIALYGFTLVDRVPSTDADTESLAERIAPPQETLFGRYWHLSAEMTDHGDSAYTTTFLEPHSDATYYDDAPALQLFNCLAFDGDGGESIQVDAFAIADQIRATDPAAYATLCRINVPGHYLEPGVHMRAERPVFRLDAHRQLRQVSFNNYDRAPMWLEAEEERSFYHAYRLFHRLAMDQRNWIKIGLRPGMALIFDNWRNLHGRMNYVGKRELYGCYHGRSAIESRHRVLRAECSRHSDSVE
ncbi:MAG: TauD/TfdA family dioxygenase [Pseudomonadota bacterium]